MKTVYRLRNPETFVAAESIISSITIQIVIYKMHNFEWQSSIFICSGFTEIAGKSYCFVYFENLKALQVYSNVVWSLESLTTRTGSQTGDLINILKMVSIKVFYKFWYFGQKAIFRNGKFWKMINHEKQEWKKSRHDKIR